MSNFPRLDETGLTHLVDKLAEKILPNKNVQSDWNESDSTSDAFIKNKPTIRSSSDLYLTSDTTITTLADADYFPFYDTSASSTKKTTLGDLKSAIGGGWDGTIPVDPSTTPTANGSIWITTT